MGSSALGMASGTDEFHASTDVTLFSSSLPVLRHEKSNLNDTKTVCEHRNDFKLQQDVEGNDLIQNVYSHAIGSLLPDDEDELLAGVADGYEFTRLPDQKELEDFDLFGSLGGMELDNDLQGSLNSGISEITLSDGVIGVGMGHNALSNGVGTVAGEHPYGEHPSRTLFVRNINSNIEESELRTLFEQYGDIRTLYTACKHRGFVMISYYDIRAARTAMRALQNKPLRRRKLDIHFSIPKDNPSDKDINQGTLVVFNLNPSVSNDDLLQIFGAYGEVKEVRETPHKRHHKFIEFYDVRAAEAALKALNRSDIAGKRIKLEPSRPGGARRNLLLQMNQEIEPDESWGFRPQIGSPMTNSLPGNWMQMSSPIENSPLQASSKSPGFGSMSPMAVGHFPGLASVHHSQISKGASVNNDYISSQMEHSFSSHSLPEPNLNQLSGKPSSFRAPPSNASCLETLSRPKFHAGSPNLCSERTNSSAWPTPSMGLSYTSDALNQGLLYSGWNGSFLNSSQQYHPHVRSAPSGVPLERDLGFFQNSFETSLVNAVAFANMKGGHTSGSFSLNSSAPHAKTANLATSGNMPEKGSSNAGMTLSSRISPIFLGNGCYPGPARMSSEGFTDHGQNRRIENYTNRMDGKKQFELDLDMILSGKDARTTLMIKNIPNKYTSKMLLAGIDENNRGTYDFLYLPVDFKNKCNVGYAFINMLSPSHIIPFFQAFNGRKWEKFNSEKVASLVYARIQGKAALVTHFQNSSLMNEDTHCHPILLDPEAGDQFVQEKFPC